MQGPAADGAVGAHGRLAGKRAVVTGAARGIGRAIAEAFVTEGAHVICADVLLDEAAAACQAMGASAQPRWLDVTDEAAWRALADELRNDSLDILVNNAGGLVSTSVLHELSLDAWRKSLDLNLTSVFLGMRAIIPLMLERGQGSVINICSISGIVGQADAPDYQAAKAGVRLLTKNAAVTYGRNRLRINAITPSVIATGPAESEPGDRVWAFVSRIPLGHAGAPQDVAHAAVYLASDESRFVTGANLVVDGGFLA